MSNDRPDRDVSSLVSVVATCYNHGKFVDDCLTSILNQDHSNFELVIVDDASTDDSASRIQAWLDRTLCPAIFISHASNLGLCASLNEALSMCNGRYVALVGTDDLLEPSKLRCQAEILDESIDEVGFVYSDATQIDESGKVLPMTFGEEHWKWRFSSPPEGEIFVDELMNPFILPVTTLIRRHCFEVIGPFDESLIYEDYDLFLRLTHRFEARYCPYISARYRIVSTSMVRTKRREIIETNVRVIAGWLGTTDYESAVRRRYRNMVDQLYEMDRQAALPHLRRLRDLDPTVRSRLRLALATIGVPYRTERWMSDTTNRVRQTLRSGKR